MTTIIGIVVLVISFVITTSVVQRLTRTNRGPKPGWTDLSGTDWRKVAVFFGLMILGMLAREAYNSLVNGKNFNWTSFLIACVVSPIVFGTIHSTLGSLEITVPSIVLSFQNGFFWNSIFENIVPANGGNPQ